MTQRTVLIVDDEVAVRDLFEQAFGDAGFAVFSAADGEEALALLDRESVPVMFTDLRMPGMTGIELCRRVRSHCSTAYIYAITGYASMFDLAKCREAGFDDCFLKPVDLAILFKTAHDAFKQIEAWAKQQQQDEAGNVCVNTGCPDNVTSGVKGSRA